jgi:hypothetical protein
VPFFAELTAPSSLSQRPGEILTRF